MTDPGARDSVDRVDDALLDDSGDEAVSDLPAAGYQWLDLVAEHRNTRFGPLWLEEVRAACVVVSRRYPPRIYAHADTWDSNSTEDLVQDVALRMVQKRQVEYIVDVAQDLTHCRQLLRRQVRLCLASRRSRTVVDNLIGRMRNLLDEVAGTAKGASQTWPLGGASTFGELARRDRVVLIAAIRRLPRAPERGVERASLIWTSDTLRKVFTLLSETLSSVSVRDLDTIFSESLTLLTPSQLAMSEAGDVDTATHDDPAEEAAVRDLAERAIARLSADEQRLLGLKFSGASDTVIAEFLGCSRPTVDSRKKAAAAKVRDALAGVGTDTGNDALQLIAEELLHRAQDIQS